MEGQLSDLIDWIGYYPTINSPEHLKALCSDGTDLLKVLSLSKIYDKYIKKGIPLPYHIPHRPMRPKEKWLSSRIDLNKNKTPLEKPDRKKCFLEVPPKYRYAQKNEIFQFQIAEIIEKHDPRVQLIAARQSLLETERYTKCENCLESKPYRKFVVNISNTQGRLCKKCFIKTKY